MQPPDNIEGEVSQGTLIGDPDTLFDDCSEGTKIFFNGKNIGDLLNEKEITWGMVFRRFYSIKQN